MWKFWKRNEATDLTRPSLDKATVWDDANPRASLQSLFELFVHKPIRETIDWYFRKRGRKRSIGLTIRILAILAAGIGVLIPVVSSLIKKDDGMPMIPATWAAVALLIGAGLIWVDRFLGATSGWLRYMSTGLRTAELLDRANLQWLRLQQSWDQTPTDDQATHALHVMRELNAEIHALIREESDQWMEEFRSSLKQLDGMVKARIEASQRAAEQVQRSLDTGLDVSVTNAESATVTLERHGEPPIEREGTSVAFAGLQPGVWRIIVVGKRMESGTLVDGGTETAVLLEAGMVSKMALSLA